MHKVVNGLKWLFAGAMAGEFCISAIVGSKWPIDNGYILLPLEGGSSEHLSGFDEWSGLKILKLLG